MRQALAHPTDRETITRTIYARVSTPGWSWYGYLNPKLPYGD